MPYDKKYNRNPVGRQGGRPTGRRDIPRAVRDDGPDRYDRRAGRDERGGFRSDRNGGERGNRYGSDERRPGRCPAPQERPQRGPERPRFDQNRPPRPPRAEGPRFDRRFTPFDSPETDPVRRYMNEAPAAAAEAMPENMLVGRNPIREAIKAGRDIEKLMIARGELSGSAREIVAKAHEAGIVVQEVDKSRLDALYKNHQGMIAFASAANYAELDDIFEAASAKEEDPFVIVLDGITDPHNLGAIIRTAECAGAHGVIVPERRGVGLTPAAVKASAGACEYVPVVRVTNVNRTLEDLKSKGLWVFGASMEGEDAYHVDLTGPVALVIGAEGEGLSELTARKCDRLISLPMKGHIDSLNASVAAGVMMYAVLNARRG